MMKLWLRTITWQQIRAKQTLETQRALGAYFLIKLFSLEELGQTEQVETHGFSSGEKWQPQQKQTSLIYFEQKKKKCKHKSIFLMGEVQK